MEFFEFFVRRPVFATVMSLIVVLVGLVCYARLTVREYPNIDEPIVSVRTDYLGASAEIIETQVTQVLESSIAGIEGIETMTSSSEPEESRITVRFRLGTNPDVAASDVRDRVARVRGQLPEEIEEPVIAKVEADAQAVIYIAFTSDRHKPIEVSDYADRYVKDRLQNIPGVAEVRIFGERRYSMRIWLDRARLAAYDLTTADVEQALRQQNVEVPAGRIESVDREFTVLARTGLVTPEQFGRIVVKTANGFPVRLSDVAKVEVGPEDERRITRFNGNNAVILGIIKQATANPLDVSHALRQAMPQLVRDLPHGMNATIAYDKSIFIDRSIAAVYETIAEAVALVVIVIFFFLRTIRATVIPLVTIPVSLIGAFALMNVLGFSINTLTLLSMVLAIGLVVDDAIVVLENIHRHTEHGMKPFRAAITGIREISSAVIAMTLTLAAVYAPVAFAPGRTGRLFAEFALTLAGAVLVSGMVAVTLSPMMCSRLLRSHEHHGRIYNFLERGFRRLNHRYATALAATLHWRPAVIAVALLVAGASYFLLTSLKSELAPIEDRGVLFTAGNAPEGSTIDFTSRYVGQFELMLKHIPEVQHYFVIVGSRAVTELISFSQLIPWEKRKRTQMEILHGIRPELSKIAGVRAFGNNPGSFGQSARDRPVQFVIQTSESYQKLEKYVDMLLTEAEKFPGLTNLDSDLRLNKPQIEVDVDRERVADTGAGVLTVGQTLRDPARRPPGHALQSERPAIRRHRPGRARRPPHAGRPQRHLRARPRRGNDPALQPRARARDGRTKGAEPVQPVPFRDDHRQHRAGLLAGPGLGLSRVRRQAHPAVDSALRFLRRIARIQGSEQQPAVRLHSGARLHLPRAGGAVRKLHRPVDHHADSTAVDDGGAAGAEPHRRHAQHLQSDRARHADRTDQQTRDPDRGVRQHAAGPGQGGARGGHGSGGAAPAADPDDHVGDGRGRYSARLRRRRRRAQPAGDRLGHRRRHDLRHAADALRRADRLHAARPRPQQGPRPRRGPRDPEGGGVRPQALCRP